MADNNREEWIGLRVNDLDATRATEQCALALALALGRNPEGGAGAPKKISVSDRLEIFAFQLMLGHVGNMACQQTISGHYFQPKKSDAQKEFDAILGENLVGRTLVELADSAWKPWKLDFLLSPVNRMGDLREGFPGAVSAIAGSEAGSFHRPESESYLVIVAEPGILLAEAMPSNGNALQEAIQGDNEAKVDATQDAVRLGHKPKGDPILGQAIRAAVTPAEGRVFSCLASPDKKLQQELSKLGRVRAFSGSPIIGALSALRPRTGINVFAAKVDCTEASMISICALATRGGFVAIPLDDKGAIQDSRLGTNSFITDGADVFLAATGITDSVVLRGVRFSEPDEVATHTMCIRTRTRSTRFVTHHHVLCDKKFRIWNSGKIELITFKDVKQRIAECLK